MGAITVIIVVPWSGIEFITQLAITIDIPNKTRQLMNTQERQECSGITSSYPPIRWNTLQSAFQTILIAEDSASVLRQSILGVLCRQE
jgi:hypothetical protein